MDTTYAEPIVLKSFPNHWTGYGAVVVAEETQTMGVARKLCKVFDNAPRGYQRVYTWEDGKWVGPFIVMGELVEITA